MVTALIPRYIGGLQNGIGDSLRCCQLNIYNPSFLILVDGSAAVHGYPPAVHRCFTGAASSLN
ncbi:hypothetical protein HAX54_010995, partial [Datura stramonium]|nr:hypothetical protein [Datura stramonium]